MGNPTRAGYWSPWALPGRPGRGILDGITMDFDISDLLFVVVVLWLAIAIINNNGGGGRRARVPAAC